jgi:hypothetical protein
MRSVGMSAKMPAPAILLLRLAWRVARMRSAPADCPDSIWPDRGSADTFRTFNP